MFDFSNEKIVNKIANEERVYYEDEGLGRKKVKNTFLANAIENRGNVTNNTNLVRNVIIIFRGRPTPDLTEVNTSSKFKAYPGVQFMLIDRRSVNNLGWYDTYVNYVNTCNITYSHRPSNKSEHRQSERSMSGTYS